MNQDHFVEHVHFGAYSPLEPMPTLGPMSTLSIPYQTFPVANLDDYSNKIHFMSENSIITFPFTQRL